MASPEDVLMKYPKLNNLSRIGAMSAKLAREFYFGKNLMARSTVYGCRDRPPLPKQQVEQLKVFLMNTFKFNKGPDFESHWRYCIDAINHSCAAIRKSVLATNATALLTSPANVVANRATNPADAFLNPTNPVLASTGVDDDHYYDPIDY